MATFSHHARFSILTQIASAEPTQKTTQPIKPVSQYFGELTFGLGQMREKLPAESYQQLLQTLEKGKRLSKEAANEIANVIKEWAVLKGATHFCHWFQPMTGLTAEKHDAFMSIQYTKHSEIRVLEKFTGSQLIQGEPDASSFPSGGMRSTFEARGYTAWDPSSPLFIIEGTHGNTLCIPSVFFGYHGEALDTKTPLLRSTEALSNAAVDFLKLIGDVDAKGVSVTLGSEQEYFLIDKRLAALRPDLLMTGRTLLGASSPRGQKLEDHYFGAIPTRVKSFMEDLEQELFRLGVPVKTRHNEVAPSQFELAPIFEQVNIATDHNTLTMETLKRIANKHGFLCLLNEKPFAGVNGSGKHCNWSLCNDRDENLLEPGSTPHQNLRFLAVIAVVLKAVHDHADAMRASIASSGNDHRLGANEAPPAIISVFLGSLLDKIFNNVEKGEAAKGTEAQIINLGVRGIPDISKDYTDRNRTSPFAFTGNKFEFRAVGASANVAVPLTILNAAVAETFANCAARLKELLQKNKNRDEAIMNLVKELAIESKNIRFEGNNYSKEWQDEAAKRGLPILRTTVEAIDVFNQPKRVEFLINQNVLKKAEIESRYHIAVERYNKTLEIEFDTLLEMISGSVVPAIEKQIYFSSNTYSKLTVDTTKKLFDFRIKELEVVLEKVLKSSKELKSILEEAHKLTNEVEKMKVLAKKAIPVAEALRHSSDSAESSISDELWPYPKYREMLFSNLIS